MNLTLQLSPEAEAKLKEKARLTGRRPEEVAMEALEDGLANEPESDAVLPSSSRLALLHAWLATKPDGNPDADISRESIYGNRGA